MAAPNQGRGGSAKDSMLFGHKNEPIEIGGGVHAFCGGPILSRIGCSGLL